MRSLVVTACLVVSLTAATAQEAAPPAPDGRFVLQAVPEGVVRLDTRTGAVTVCRNEAGSWMCRATPDERRAVEEENERLARENAALRARIADLERRDAPEGANRLRMPTDREIDEMVSVLDRFMRRMRSTVEGWTRGDAPPQR